MKTKNKRILRKDPLRAILDPCHKCLNFYPEILCRWNKRSGARSLIDIFRIGSYRESKQFEGLFRV